MSGGGCAKTSCVPRYLPGDCCKRELHLQTTEGISARECLWVLQSSDERRFLRLTGSKEHDIVADTPFGPFGASLVYSPVTELMSLLLLCKDLVEQGGGGGSSIHDPLGRKIRFHWGFVLLFVRKSDPSNRLRRVSCLVNGAVLFHVWPFFGFLHARALPTPLDCTRAEIRVPHIPPLVKRDHMILRDRGARRDSSIRG